MEAAMESRSSKTERPTSPRDFIDQCIRADEGERKRLVEVNRPLPAEPTDLVELLGEDASKLAAWAREARKANAEHIEKVKARSLKYPVEEVPQPKWPFPLDQRPDNKSLPLCLSTPDHARFSELVNGAADLTIPAMTFNYESSGVGGPIGIEAAPYVPPQTASFWYGFLPPAGGTLLVLGALDLRFLSLAGLRRTSSDLRRFLFKNPALFPGIYATAWAEMYIRVHQYGTFGPQTARLPVYRFEHNGSWGGEIRIILSSPATVLAAQIVPDEPVAIEIGLEFHADGHSDFCTAGVTAYSTGVIVKALCLNLLPPEVIL
jgi:hypothetical protein